MKNILFLCLFICSVLFADVVLKPTEILLNGKSIGMIETLTPLEIVADDGKMAKVKVKGVVNQNYQLLIQKSIQNGENYVKFADENPQNFTIVKELEDDYGEIWYEIEGEYAINSDAITSDIKVLYDRAKHIYEDSCSACHRVHEPDAFTPNQWPANIQSMIDLNYVIMQSDDLSLVTKYLQHHAKTE